MTALSSASKATAKVRMIDLTGVFVLISEWACVIVEGVRRAAFELEHQPNGRVHTEKQEGDQDVPAGNQAVSQEDGQVRTVAVMVQATAMNHLGLDLAVRLEIRGGHPEHDDEGGNVSGHDDFENLHGRVFHD